MSRLGPLVAALAVFPLIAAAAVLPYVAHEYRRRGTVGAGRLILSGAFALYLVGLSFYVILPLREVSPDFCAAYGVDAYISPLRIVDEIRGEAVRTDWRTLLGSGALQQLVLNVFLFIPLGMFVRHLLRRGVAATVALGVGVSLAIELTQLTGNWFLYPCSYRYFDTADLLANASGAAMGAVLAPLLRLVPAQYVADDPGGPRPVTPARRMLAVACDAAVLLALGIVLLAVAGLFLEATRGELFASESIRARALRAVTLVWLPGVLLLAVGPLFWQGRTPGDWAVLLRPQTSRGEPPPRELVLARFVCGPAGLLALAGLGVLGLEIAWLGLGLAVVLQALALYTTPLGEDGAALTRTGIRLGDARRDSSAAGLRAGPRARTR